MPDCRGHFLWYELLTSEPDAAADFYHDVVGWGSAAWEGGPQPYTMWMNGETPVGGLMQLPEEVAAEGVPPHWLPYIGTPDVDATIARAVELGATVLVPPMDIPDVGRIVVLADPQGAAFAAYTPATTTDEMLDQGVPGVGQFSWHELATTDHEAAFEFYSDLFGWEKTNAMDMGGGAMYQMYGIPEGRELGGMYDKPPEVPVAYWLLYAKVSDAEGAADTVSQAGGRVLNGPMEVPGGDRVAQCMDPQGAAFAVHATAT